MMKAKIESRLHWRQVVIAVVFFVLFPGFFFYDTLLGLDYIPPIFGGYFGPVSLAAFPLVLYIYIRDIARYKKSWSASDIIFLLLMAFSMGVSVINFTAGRLAFGVREMLIYSLSGVLFNLMTYILSRSVPVESIKFRKYIYLSLFAMGLIALLNVGDEGIFYLQEQSANRDFVSTYQGFARSIAVIALVAIAVAEGLFVFAIAAFIGVLALFLNGARTELVSFFVATILLSFTRFGILKTLSLNIGFMLPIILVLYGLSPDTYEKYVSNNRNLQLFDLENATSVQLRNYLNEFAIRTISENPVFGDYASYLVIPGLVGTSGNSGLGSYAHNILSAWVNLGLLGFVGYICIPILITFYVMTNLKKIRAGGVEWNLVIAFASFYIVAAIFGTEYTYMFFGLTVGFYARAISNLNSGPIKFSAVAFRR
jgi:hypothetical protein